MANQHERLDDSFFNNASTMRINDRVALYLMQQLGIQTNSEPIILNQEEEAKLAQMEQKNQTKIAVKNLVDKILSESSNITEKELKQILLAEGITKPELLEFAVNHFSSEQIFERFKTNANY